MKGVLTRALRGIDDAVTRAAALTPVTLLWPGLIAVAAAAAAWAYAHSEQIAKLGTNKVTKEARTEGLHYAASAAAAVVLLYVAVIVVTRLASGSWKPLAVTNRLNRLFSFVLAAPLVMALTVPNIETKVVSLTYIAIAGLVCLPTFAVLFGGSDSDGWADEDKQGRWRKQLERAAPFAVAIVIVALWLGYSYFFSRLAITQHQAFGTRTIDLGYYDNIFYQSIHGRPLACSMLRSGTHASAHFDPILVLLSPLYLIHPRAELLLVLQSVWLGSGAIPAYLLGKHALDSRQAGIILAIVYLLYPALHGANMYEFHSLTLIAMPMLWAIYFLERKNKLGYFVTLAVLLLIREDVPLIMCFVGGYAILTRRPGLARIGWITILVSIAYFVTVKGFFMTSSAFLNDGEGANGFSYYFSDMIPQKGGISDLVISVITNPAFIVKHVIREVKIIYLAKLFLPVLLVPLLARPGRFMLLYGFVFLLLATRKAVFSTHFQYSMVIFPVILALTPVGLRRLRDSGLPDRLGLRPQALVGSLLGAMLITSALMTWKFGGFVENTVFRGGFTRVVRELTPEHQARYAKIRELIDKHIEPGAAVSATNRLGPHISNRKDAFRYRDRKRSHYVFAEVPGIKGGLLKWHNDRVQRGELVQIGAYKQMKLFRVINDPRQRKPKPKTTKPKPSNRKRPQRRKPPTPSKSSPRVPKPPPPSALPSTHSVVPPDSPFPRDLR